VCLSSSCRRSLAPQEELRGHFLNISAVMDCVGCEKCKLWGKLQMLGLGTALKVLFPPHSGARLVLARNEVIALVNLLHRLAESLRAAAAMNDAIRKGEVDLRSAPAAHEERSPFGFF